MALAVRQSTCIAYAARLATGQTSPIIGETGLKRKMAGAWMLSLFHALVIVRRPEAKAIPEAGPQSIK